MVFEDVTVHEVLPAGVAPSAARGHWTCCACGSTYPVEDGWKVLYDTVPGVTVVAYVCPECAVAARD